MKALAIAVVLGAVIYALHLVPELIALLLPAGVVFVLLGVIILGAVAYVWRIIAEELDK